MATLLPTAANKTRPNGSSDVFCCLEIKNRKLNLWHQNKKKKNASIVTQLQSEGINTEFTGEGLKPLLQNSSAVGSLEDRLCSRARQLSSNLFRLHKKYRNALLEKKFVIDVKTKDVVPVDSLLPTINDLRYVLHQKFEVFII